MDINDIKNFSTKKLSKKYSIFLTFQEYIGIDKRQGIVYKHNNNGLSNILEEILLLEINKLFDNNVKFTHIKFNIIDIDNDKITYYCYSYYEPFSIQDIAKQHYNWIEDMGWHNSSTLLEKLALVASEVGEAINECRNETPTENFRNELADIILRVIDIQESLGYDIELDLRKKMFKNVLRGNKGRLK